VADMSRKTILDVGQCGYDGPRMMQMLKSKVGVDVDSADSIADATEKLATNEYDLVLVNREFAFEDETGLDLIEAMKESGDETPVMLVSDRPDAQEEAHRLGAVCGFGKAKLAAPETVELIRKTIGLD
jgi:DNA-binding response OmpR family regulator